MSLSKSWEVLKTLKEKKQLEPYIKHIRFPYFKNLEEGLKIEFDFPLTAIVGANGTNKSSVLRAIYGCPEDQNVGNFWFSTDIDPITEDGGRPRFIYSYYQEAAKRDVEVIKTRILRKYGSKKVKKVNPDYWEPSRPILSDGMEKMPKTVEFVGRTKTRWKLMKKDVIFMDFRSEISAFDKYFYHGDLKQTLRFNTKQEYIRSKSIHLKNAVDKNLKSKTLYRDEKIVRNSLLSQDQLKSISYILGRKYKNIRLIGHRFFKYEGESVILESENLNYSEAFAGSGEFAVVMLVNKVSEAKPNSLIILDEPEVSLHPGAQERLVKFLLDKIKTDKHQIVIGTHSPFILKQLPPEAIKTLYHDPSSAKIKALNETLPEEAFFHLGVEKNSTSNIFVEDRLAGALVEKALRTLGQPIHQNFSVIPTPGGASVLLTNYLLAYALTDRQDSLFILDEDQKPAEEINLEIDFDSTSSEALKDLMVGIFGSKISIPVDGGDGGAKDDQLRDLTIKILIYCKKYLRYLPGVNPEAFIWENMAFDVSEHKEQFDKIHDYKEKFRVLAKIELGLRDYEDVTGNEIFHIQQGCLARVDDELLGGVADSITQFMNN